MDVPSKKIDTKDHSDRQDKGSEEKTGAKDVITPKPIPIRHQIFANLWPVNVQRAVNQHDEKDEYVRYSWKSVT